jgi:hypothetical protein
MEERLDCGCLATIRWPEPDTRTRCIISRCTLREPPTPDPSIRWESDFRHFIQTWERTHGKDHEMSRLARTTRRHRPWPKNLGGNSFADFPWVPLSLPTFQASLVSLCVRVVNLLVRVLVWPCFCRTDEAYQKMVDATRHRSNASAKTGGDACRYPLPMGP